MHASIPNKDCGARRRSRSCEILNKHQNTWTSSISLRIPQSVAFSTLCESESGASVSSSCILGCRSQPYPNISVPCARLSWLKCGSMDSGVGIAFGPRASHRLPNGSNRIGHCGAITDLTLMATMFGSQSSRSSPRARWVSSVRRDRHEHAAQADFTSGQRTSYVRATLTIGDGSRWHRGHIVVPRPPTTSRLSDVPHLGQGSSDRPLP